LLPSANYTFEGATYAKGATEAEVKLTIKSFASLDYGDYLLPLKVEMAGQQVFHLVKVHKDGEFSALSETSKKTMPPGSYSCPNRKEPMKMVAYVETNDWDIRNMGQFVLKDSKKPVFDIVVLFAANMNYDAKKGKRYLFFNDKLQPILKDPDKYIKPLKDRGIKVIVDILPNHQGVGYLNFQNYEEAVEFARECKQYADKYGFDGYDIDEEYAEYDKVEDKPYVGSKSILWFMRAMKEVMPDKLLTLYDYGHGLYGSVTDDQGKEAKEYIDYSWANYGEDHGSYIGVPKEKYGKKSIEANWGTYGAEYVAESNLNGCFGLMMIFNINGNNIENGRTTEDLSEATKKLYGEECIFSGKYHKGPKDR
jgi:endo-beta-N-acetylglucosaminidase H